MNIYKTISEYNNKEVFYNNNICYIPIINYGDFYTCGITENNVFCLTTIGKFYLLENANSYVSILPLLEEDPKIIKIRLENIYNPVFTNLRWYNLLPIINCLNFLYSNYKREYWVNLSLNWIETLPLIEIEKFQIQLNEIYKNKNFSQKLRNSIFKLLKNRNLLIKLEVKNDEPWTLEKPEE